MSQPLQPTGSITANGRAMAAAFAAGFLATFFFHQVAVGILHFIGMTPVTAFSLRPTAPLGVPAVFSLAVWGGIWGIFLAWVARRFPTGRLYWVVVAVFGAVPTLAGWFVVAPLKGLPMALDGELPWMLAAFIAAMVWALGTMLLLHWWWAAAPSLTGKQ